MRKSDLLRVQDVRDAYRLIGDCRDLGSEPAPQRVSPQTSAAACSRVMV